MDLLEKWGWFYPETTEVAQSLLAELQRELSPGHLIFGCSVETAAYRKDQDDVLFRHTNEDRFTVIHLTWIRRRETDTCFPSVSFDGTFAEFLAAEKENWSGQ